MDGGPTRNGWLMQFQSDILACPVMVPQAEELSGIGAAYAAGLGVGLYGEEVFSRAVYQPFNPQMEQEERTALYRGWKAAVDSIL